MPPQRVDCEISHRLERGMKHSLLGAKGDNICNRWLGLFQMISEPPQSVDCENTPGVNCEVWYEL